MAMKKYSEYLEINPLFESVVDIDADKRNANLWREYIVGQEMKHLVELLCQSLGNESPDARRSFWLHGTYGTGKSYAAIFLKHLIEEQPAVIEDFLEKNQKLSEFRNRLGRIRRSGNFLTVWKTGCTGIRDGGQLMLEMEQSITNALIEKFGDDADLGSSSLIGTIREKLADPSINWDYMIENSVLADDYSSVDEVRERVAAGDLDTVKQISTLLRERGIGMTNSLRTFEAWVKEVIDSNGLSKGGIFFIWDEFTEYVSHSDDRTVLQQLSEFVKVAPLFITFVVHRSPEMVNTIGLETYQLITHRFHEVEFHINADAAFDLIAGSINTRTGMQNHWDGVRREVIGTIKKYLPDMEGLDDKISNMIEQLCPMHPMTIKLLSRVSESFAASQRTMFRFMKDQSSEEYGFSGYIRHYGPEDQACWLTPDWLWDYFFTRESDFSDKETKVAEYIRWYEEKRDLVESDENALRIFKVSMLLLAVMSTTKGLYGGKRTQDGISATKECLQQCLAGVIAAGTVSDMLETFEESKILLCDEASNGVVRLQLPFRGGGSDFDVRFAENDKKYTRYKMFEKDGVFAKLVEEKAWTKNEASFRRMKVAACFAETNSIKKRQEEIEAELNKYSYKLGLLIVTVSSEGQFKSMQAELAGRAANCGNPRLSFALVKTPYTDEKRKQWLTSRTKQEMAAASGSTGSAAQYQNEATMNTNTWVNEAINGPIYLWNGSQAFGQQFGMAQLRKVLEKKVLQELFPFAPELFVNTTTAYNACNDAATKSGVTRAASNAQLKTVLMSLDNAGILQCPSIEAMAMLSGSKTAECIAQLASFIKNKMESGQKVVLADLWESLQREPFGYYDTIACGVILGYVFSCYKDGVFSWTDSAQSTHSLGEATLSTMIKEMCKGKLTTDYLSAGTVTFQHFREYAKKIMNLTDAQVTTETECWRNMREAVTKSGAPIWALKYMPDEEYGSDDNKEAAIKIVDDLQRFLLQESERESTMSSVINLFNSRGRLRLTLGKAFMDKHKLADAFRSFLFANSPDLQLTADLLSISPEVLSDKLHRVMQDAIYTWTEEQVCEKLDDVASEYEFLFAITKTVSTAVYNSEEAARKELHNMFQHFCVAMEAVEKLGKDYYPALQVLHKVAAGSAARMTIEERRQDIDVLDKYGKAAYAVLQDAKPLVGDLLEANGIEYSREELDAVYTGIHDMTADTPIAHFEKELKLQIGRISQSRNRAKLKERWLAITGTESVKEWCSRYGAPLMWLVSKEEGRAIQTIIDVQNNAHTMDQQVQNALNILESMDAAILVDKDRIAGVFTQVVGREYASLIEADTVGIMTRAKLKLGNDMSAWSFAELSTLQQMLKKELQEKAKKEKLESTKSGVMSMNSNNLRSRVVNFLSEHPEFCDEFAE